jgi:hypothetical protein
MVICIPHHHVTRRRTLYLLGTMSQLSQLSHHPSILQPEQIRDLLLVLIRAAHQENRLSYFMDKCSH